VEAGEPGHQAGEGARPLVGAVQHGAERGVGGDERVPVLAQPGRALADEGGELQQRGEPPGRGGPLPPPAGREGHVPEHVDRPGEDQRADRDREVLAQALGEGEAVLVPEGAAEHLARGRAVPEQRGLPGDVGAEPVPGGGVHPGGLPAGEVGTRRLQGPHQPLEGIGRDRRVPVGEGEVAAARPGDPEVPRRAGVAGVGGHHGEPLVRQGYGRRPPGEDHLDGGEGLRAERRQALCEAPLSTAHVHDDRERGG